MSRPTNPELITPAEHQRRISSRKATKAALKGSVGEEAEPTKKKPSARKAVETLLKMGKEEQHLLQALGADSFVEAMRDEGNYMNFLSAAEDLYEPMLPEKRFAEMLTEAATISRENAEFFLECYKDLLERLHNKEAVKKAVQAARAYLKKK